MISDQRALADFRKESDVIHPRSINDKVDGEFGDLGTAAEKRVQHMMVNAMKNADCPEEQLEHLGIR